MNPIFFHKDSIDADGRVFLALRKLDIPQAQKCGVASSNGFIHFAYCINGQVVRWKSRSISDKKVQFTSKSPDSESKDFKFPFWNHQIWPTSDYLIITEGELDCLAILRLTGSNAVSLPHGAGSIESAIKNNYEYIQQFKEIYIATDMDAAGEEAAKKAMALIPPQKYRRIVFPCKDANDWLIKENPSLDDLKHLMRNSRRIEHKFITPTTQLSDDYFKALDMGQSTGWENLDKILGGVRKGEVTVISADTGAGKTSFCINLFYNLANSGHAVWVNSYEMSPLTINRKIASLVLRTRLKVREFKNEEVQYYKDWSREHKCFINEPRATPTLVELRNQFEVASLVYGINYIFLDHFDYIYGLGDKGSTMENIDEAIRGLHILAVEFNISVILVVHPKNVPTNQEIQMSDLKGSSSIKQYADNIILLSRLDRTDKEKVNKVKVRVCKNRLFGKEGSFIFSYNPEIDCFME